MSFLILRAVILRYDKATKTETKLYNIFLMYDIYLAGLIGASCLYLSGVTKIPLVVLINHLSNLIGTLINLFGGCYLTYQPHFECSDWLNSVQVC